VVSFTPGEITPKPHWIGGSVGARAGLDVVGKRNISCPYKVSNPHSSAVQPLGHRYTDCGILALVLEIILSKEGMFIARALEAMHTQQLNLSEVQFIRFKNSDMVISVSIV
jgi:hypothetical protein